MTFPSVLIVFDSNQSVEEASFKHFKLETTNLIIVTHAIGINFPLPGEKRGLISNLVGLRVKLNYFIKSKDSSLTYSAACVSRVS